MSVSNSGSSNNSPSHGGTEKPSPFVFWAQTDNIITLRVELINSKSPNVNLTSNGLEFTAYGVGARGDHEYYFSLDFYSTILAEESKYRISDRQIDFHIKKTNPEMWPRLTENQKKPAWLKFDFDKFQTEDDDDDDDDDIDEVDDEEIQNYNNSREEKMYNKLLQDLTKPQKRREKRVEEFRKIYLLLYNIFQFVGFLYIILVMTIRYAKEGPESMEGTYMAVGKAFKFCQLLQLLEVLHPMLGYTAGSPLFPFLQILGRLIILFPLIDFEERMHAKPVVFYIFLIYSLAEIIRYPYYMLRTYEAKIGALTWLRYTLWTVLYPLGFLCEGIIILRNIPYYEETGRLSVFLPNALNFSFYFPTVLRVYLLIGFFPMMYFMMTYMYRQRVKMVGPKSAAQKKKE